MRLFPLEALLGRLANRLGLLRGGPQDQPARQHSLRQALAWSYDLLDEPGQALFRRFSVFSGGATLEAVEAVGGGRVETLEGLVEHSLVRREGVGREPRFGMLETLRDYAEERLRDSGEAEGTWHCHARYFLELAEAAEPNLLVPQQAAWLDRLDREQDNFRAVFGWCKERGPDGTPERTRVEIALRLAGALWPFWEIRGHLAEGRAHLQTALSLAENTDNADALARWRAKALIGAGMLAWRHGELSSARSYLLESAALYRKLGEQVRLAWALNNLGGIAYDQGDLATARGFYEQSLGFMRAAADKRGTAVVLNNLSGLASRVGDWPTTRALLEESLALVRELNHQQYVAWVLGNLGVVCFEEGNYAAAAGLYEESLALMRELNDRRGIGWILNYQADVARENGDATTARRLYAASITILHEIGHELGIAWSLEGLAGVAASRRESERVLRLAGAAAALRRRMNTPTTPAQQARLERWLQTAREVLNPDVSNAAWAAGQALPLDQAIADGLGARS